MKALFALFLLQFTQPAPLTNTRYEPVDAHAVLTSNGSEFFIAWTQGSFVRIARVLDGEPVAGIPVLSTTDIVRAGPSIVWTGAQFVVASENRVRVLDARGQPAGPEIALEPVGYSAKLATNGRNVVLVRYTATGVRAHVLTLSGVPLDSGTRIASSLEAEDAAIASDGEGYLIITTSGAGVRITRLDENGRVVMQRTVPGERSNLPPAIASDGTDYFAVWTVGLGHLRGAFIKADGTVQTPFNVATMPRFAPYVPLFFQAGAVTWTGSHYTVAYGLTNDFNEFLSYEVRDIGSTRGRAELQGRAFARPSLAYAAGRLLVSWGTANGIVVRDLTRNDLGFRATWTVNAQRVHQAVASSNGTLVLWREAHRRTTWRMGFRGHDGSWSERELPYSGSRIAATNGQEFVIVANDDGKRTGTATFLSASGVPNPASVTIPFLTTGMAWNGGAYVLVGLSNVSGEIVAARLSPSGALSDAVVVRAGDDLISEKPRVASDGTNVLVASLAVKWSVVCSPFCLPPIYHIETVLLDRNLQRITAPIRIRLDSQLIDVIWAGTHYVVVYNAIPTQEIKAMRVSPAGLIASFTTVAFWRDYSPDITATRVGDAAAIAWSGDQIRLLHHDGRVSTPIASSSTDMPAIVVLPGDRIGYFGTRTLVEEPYYGSTRIVMSIGNAIPLQPADPPKISATLEGDSMIVTWTPPPQPVHGYRLEYKNGDEGWLELERWFGPNERSAVLALTKRRTTTFAFRVRAWNDGGVSLYSNAALLHFARQRSVR